MRLTRIRLIRIFARFKLEGFVMRKRIYDYYVVSARFNGRGRGFAIGFDSEKAAHIFADVILFGWGQVLADWQVERDYPTWYHSRVS